MASAMWEVAVHAVTLFGPRHAGNCGRAQWVRRSPSPVRPRAARVPSLDRKFPPALQGRCSHAGVARHPVALTAPDLAPGRRRGMGTPTAATARHGGPFHPGGEGHGPRTAVARWKVGDGTSATGGCGRLHPDAG